MKTDAMATTGGKVTISDPPIPDPIERLIRTEADLDHARAKARGLRVRDLTHMVVNALDGHGVIRDQEKARVIVWAVLADALYGNAAVDIYNGK